MLKKLIIRLLAIAFVFSLAGEVYAANEGVKREAQRFLRQANRSLNSDEFDQALDQLRRAEEKIERLIDEAAQQQQQDNGQQQSEQTAQIAPDDPRFNNPLNIPLDNTASVLDFVSYPGGDREDRVRWDISGMNANAALPGGRARLVIAVSCFGENRSSIRFFTGGRNFTCGQTLVDREVTYDSRTGSVVITATGGEGTYVQWVLTGTATRVN